MICISLKEIQQGKINYTTEQHFINSFIELPSKLYGEKSVQNKELELKLLKETHELSHYFDTYPLVVINDGVILARCIVTIYPDTDNAYIGFFECIEDYNVCRIILDAASCIAVENHRNTIVGPVNCSFWLGYRFRTDGENNYFTGEAYNKKYYTEYFKKYGFKITDEFISYFSKDNKYIIDNNKYIKRLQLMKENGIEFKSLNSNNIAKQMIEIYELTMNLFSDFPTFHKITQYEFDVLFRPIVKIINNDMMILAYKDNKLVGWVTVIPNIYNKTSILDILRYKLFPKEYIAMYMGVDKSVFGLGGAMTELLRQKLIKKKAKAIGAMIHTGKASAVYYNYLHGETHNYVLLKKELAQLVD